MVMFVIYRKLNHLNQKRGMKKFIRAADLREFYYILIGLNVKRIINYIIHRLSFAGVSGIKIQMVFFLIKLLSIGYIK